jgi:DNA-binding MarR family transcriptional regulator
MPKATKAPEAPKPEAAEPMAVRVPQVRILKALARAKNPLNSAQISERADVPMTAVVGKLGSEDLTDRANTEARHGYKSLITWGYVKAERVVIDAEVSDRTERRYHLTAAGRKFLESLKS